MATRIESTSASSTPASCVSTAWALRTIARYGSPRSPNSSQSTPRRPQVYTGWTSAATTAPSSTLIAVLCRNTSRPTVANPSAKTETIIPVINTKISVRPTTTSSHRRSAVCPSMPASWATAADRATVPAMRVSLRGRQGGRRIDLVLGLLVAAAVVTGIAANTVGVNWPLDLIQLHAGAAVAILLLAPWKYVVIRRGLRRARRGLGKKALSLTLAGFVLVAIGSGLLHSTGKVEFVGPLTLMQIHVGAAVGALLAVVAHFVGHAVRPRRADADRRALLRLGVLGAGAAVATAAWDTAAVAGGRRFTGSIEKPYLEVTTWFDDGIPEIDPASWRLRVGSAEFDLEAVRALPHERFTAI